MNRSELKREEIKKGKRKKYMLQRKHNTAEVVDTRRQELKK